MRTAEQVREEIEALRRFAESCLDDEAAQISVESQISALEWASRDQIVAIARVAG